MGLIIFIKNEKKEVQHFVEFLLYKEKQDKPIKKRQFGCAKDKIVMLDNFDEPLDDFKEYMFQT